MTRQLVLLQLALVASVALGAAPLGAPVLTAAVLGASIGALANMYFARRVFSMPGPSAAESVSGACLRAEVGKLLMVGSMFALAFSLLEGLHVVASLFGYLVLHLGTSFGAVAFDRTPAPIRTGAIELENS